LGLDKEEAVTASPVLGKKNPWPVMKARGLGLIPPDHGRNDNHSHFSSCLLKELSENQGKEAAVSLPSAVARKAPGGVKSRGVALLADLKLTHPCDQIVIGAGGGDDQMRLAG